MYLLFMLMMFVPYFLVQNSNNYPEYNPEFDSGYFEFEASKIFFWGSKLELP